MEDNINKSSKRNVSIIALVKEGNSTSSRNILLYWPFYQGLYKIVKIRTLKKQNEGNMGTPITILKSVVLKNTLDIYCSHFSHFLHKILLKKNRVHSIWMNYNVRETCEKCEQIGGVSLEHLQRSF